MWASEFEYFFLWTSLEICVSIGGSHYQAELPTNTPFPAATAAALNNSSSTEINKSRKNAFGPSTPIYDGADDVVHVFKSD